MLNPNSEQREKSDLHLTVSGTKDAVMMVEAGANEISEDEMLGAILFAHEEIKKICAFIQGIKDEIGKPDFEYRNARNPRRTGRSRERKFYDRMVWAMEPFDRKERSEREAAVKAEAVEYFTEQFPEGKGRY